MQPWRYIVDKALNQCCDFLHIGHQVVVIQHQHSFVVELVGQDIEKRRQ